MSTTYMLALDGRRIEVTDDPARVDGDALWEFLSTDAYWGLWRQRSDVEAQVAGAWRVVTAHDGNAMVGFARAVSDGVALAYLADVYVIESHRAQGIGQALVSKMIEDGPGSGFRWMLHTRDAHSLYAEFGFTGPDPTYLERAARR